MKKNKFLKKIFSSITLVMFSMSLFSVDVKAVTEDMIKNSSFKNSLDSWTLKGDKDVISINSGWGYDDTYSLNYWSSKDYEAWTEQTIKGLENGFYKLEVYAASGGGQEAIYLYANDFGGSGARATVPVSNSFTKVVLNFEVTNGEATIGVYSKGKSGNWSNFDNISLKKVDEENKFLKGGDLTMVNLMEDKGATYYDADGQARDVFHILAENGFNIVRLRTHNDTGRETGIDDWYLPDGYQNTEDILKLAKRAKEVGMEIELTLNYSDWWPNGTTQEIPSSWKKEIEGLSYEESVDKLEELIYEYTKDVMTQLANQGTIPEYISLGNEMHAGILFPYGKVGNTNEFKRFINAGYKAVKEVSTNTQVILHLDDAGNTAKYTSFFDTCENNNINYDVIGASYYPFWTKKNIEDIVPWFNMIGEKYQKKIMIMETGYNWNDTLPSGEPGQLKDNGYESHPSTPQGQKEFLDELFNSINSAEKNWVIGDLYWDPVMIAQDGVGWAMGRGEAEDGSQDKAGDNVVSNTTIFDFDGKALNAVKSFRDNTNGSNTGIISGLVVGENGNKIVNANVTVTIGGKEYEKTTDRYGRFFIVNLPKEDGSVSVDKNGYISSEKSFTIIPGATTNITIELGSGSVQGLVKDTDGNLVADAEIYTIIDENKISTFSKEDGSYILEDLPAGDNFTIYAEKKGYESSSVAGVKVVSKEITNNINIEMKLNSGSVSGIVIDNNGDKVQGATVELISKDNNKYTCVTDSDGKYIINYVLVGSDYKITVNKKGYIESKLEGITIEKGKTTSNVDIVIKDNFGSITGTVVDSNNHRISGAVIEVTRKGEKVSSINSDENGRFEIAKVLDNPDYLVTIKKDGFGGVILNNIGVTPGENTELVIRMSTPIKVENSGFDTGNYDGWTIEAPQGGVKVADRTWDNNDAPSGKHVLNLWSDKEYSVNISQEITGLKSGKYELSAMIYSGGFQKSAVMFVNGEEKKLEKTEGWVKVSLPVWIEGDTAKIGFDFDAISGEWILIDSVEFNYITSNKYDDLEEAINNANKISSEEYTKSSFLKLQEELKAAKELLVTPDINQEDINNKIIALNTAIESLIKKANKEELKAKIEELESIDETKYTKESFDNLKNMILIAKEVLQDDEARQDDVNYALENLNKAFESLKLNPEDTDEDDNTNNGGNSNQNNDNDGSQNNSDDSNQNNVSGNLNNSDANSNTLPATGGKVSSSFILYISTLSILIGSVMYRSNSFRKSKNIN